MKISNYEAAVGYIDTVPQTCYLPVSYYDSVVYDYDNGAGDRVAAVVLLAISW